MIHFLISLMTNYVAIKGQERHFPHILKIRFKIPVFVQKFFQSLGCSEGLRVVVLNSASLSPWLPFKVLAWQKLSVTIKIVLSLVGGILIIVWAASKSKDQTAVLLPEKYQLDNTKYLKAVLLVWNGKHICHSICMARILNMAQVLETPHQIVNCGHRMSHVFLFVLDLYPTLNNNNFSWTLIVAWPKLHFICRSVSVFNEAFSVFWNSLSIIFSFILKEAFCFP